LKLSLKILTVFTVAWVSCNQTPKTGSILTTPIQVPVDTSYSEIYDFMKEIIVSEKLNLKNGLESEPDPNCDIQEADKDYLPNFLIGSEKSTNKVDPETGNILYTLDQFDRCLTRDDITYMLSQKHEHYGFKWDISRLGFNTNSADFWYTFSIPLFSRDKTRAIMMIRSLCPGLCGSGQTVLFKKEKGKWIAKPSGQWYH